MLTSPAAETNAVDAKQVPAAQGAGAAPALRRTKVGVRRNREAIERLRIDLKADLALADEPLGTQRPSAEASRRRGRAARASRRSEPPGRPGDPGSARASRS